MAVTGYAGPYEEADARIGTIHIAVAIRDRATQHEHHDFASMDRAEVRTASVAAALRLLERAPAGPAPKGRG